MRTVIAFLSKKRNAFIVWIVIVIIPSINLFSLSSPFLNFKTSTAFADNSKLEILYSTDFDGSLSQIKKSTWTEIETRIASDDDNDLI